MEKSPGSVAPAVELSAEERDYLSRQVRRDRVGQAFSERCNIILRCAEGLSDNQIAIELNLREKTVEKWRRRFLCDRVDGLIAWAIGDIAPLVVILVLIISIWSASIYAHVFAK